VDEDCLGPGLYLDYLNEVLNKIASEGRAAVVGKGANFVLRRENRFAVRMVAPLEIRIENICRTSGIPAKDARKRILNRDRRRERFVKKSFDRTRTDPKVYDLLLNVERLGADSAAEAIIAAYKACAAVKSRKRINFLQVFIANGILIKTGMPLAFYISADIISIQEALYPACLHAAKYGFRHSKCGPVLLFFLPS
jgi:hypothetical protein